MPDDFVVTVQRTKYLGDCPVVTFEVRASGEADYDGRAQVAQTGNRTLSVPHGDVRAIWLLIQSVGFFELRDRYVMEDLRDRPGTIITVRAHGTTKCIVNSCAYPSSAQQRESNPDLEVHTALDVLALDIERASGVARLVYGYMP